jgi:hypothetical protein
MGESCSPLIIEKEVTVIEYKLRIQYVYPNLGCDGVPSSGAVPDSCGVCGGSGTTCMDCAGVPHGSAVLDRCAQCVSEAADACAVDCRGTWGGDVVEDECGICGGDGSTCTQTKSRMSVPMETCPSVAEVNAMRTAIADQYGVDVSMVKFGGSCWDEYLASTVGRRSLQSGNTLVVDIALPNGQAAPTPEELGSSTGLDTSSVTSAVLVYDCFGESHKESAVLPVVDACGICDGTGSSCADCAGIPNGPNVADKCDGCDADAANDCALDCHGVWGGPAIVDTCDVCGGSSACIVCTAGEEKCDAQLRCPGGCRDCPAGAASLPGEVCAACLDGTAPNGGGSACVPCPRGSAGVGGQCASCPKAMEPDALLTACVVCQDGEHNSDVGSSCVHCPPGSEPDATKMACALCPYGHRSSAEETGGLCAPCGKGQQPTDAAFAPKAAGASRCSECGVGQYSAYDPQLKVSHRCVQVRQAPS